MDSIYVTKTYLPPLDEYVSLLQEIWNSHLVTNDGPLYQRFERELSAFTEIPHLACVSNGTLALQIAVRALDLHGDVITTPFTHVASSGCLSWEGCRPVYADIDAETLNINPALIEERITDQTVAILPVHVYSNPCDVEAIARIAEKHRLKVIYDGAHAFGAMCNGRSIFAYGDISMASFNATKGFHTVEGGALFAQNDEEIASIRRLAYFGMNSQKEIVQRHGTNAKMIEFCAAMGLLNLRHFLSAVMARRRLYEQYVDRLKSNSRIRLQRLTGEINYSYMPVVCESEVCKQSVISALRAQSVFPREYFFPSLETVFSSEITCPIAHDVSRRVLCLPMSDYLTPSDVDRIHDILNAPI